MGCHWGGNKFCFAGIAPAEVDEVSVAERVWFLAFAQANVIRSHSA